MKREMTCAAEMEKLETVMRWVRTCCAEAGLERKKSGEVELAMEEVVTNIIRHAYPGKKGELSLVCNLTDERVEFIVKDQGVMFNPLVQKPEVDQAAELEERREGGLGIFFVSKLVDSVHYERQEPFNILILSKQIA